MVQRGEVTCPGAPSWPRRTREPGLGGCDSGARALPLGHMAIVTTVSACAAGRHHAPALDDSGPITFQVAKSHRVTGFLLPEGSGELSGNWGLLDQVAALTWVQTHISVFGGDPRRVALAADRGGADVASIHLLTAGAATPSLFQRAVLMVSCLWPSAWLQAGQARGLSRLSRPVGSFTLCSDCVSCSWASLHVHVSQGAEGLP